MFIKFLLFYGSNYYPEGGWNDYYGSYDSIDAAKDKIIADNMDNDSLKFVDWYHIVAFNYGDLSTKIVEHGCGADLIKED